MMLSRDDIIGEIARKNLHIQTLETRNSDILDFYNLSIWSIKQALEAAYDAGFKDGKDFAKSYLIENEESNNG